MLLLKHWRYNVNVLHNSPTNTFASSLYNLSNVTSPYLIAYYYSSNLVSCENREMQPAQNLIIAVHASRQARKQKTARLARKCRPCGNRKV